MSTLRGMNFPAPRILVLAFSQLFSLILLSARNEGQAFPAENANPRYFGASLGALANVRQGIRSGNESLLPAFKVLLRDARQALNTAPPTVTDKKRHPVSGILNDYYSQAPYLWPDPSKPDGLPYLPIDGVINPESRHADFTDQSRGASIGQLVETLALAYYLTGEEQYAAHAARCLKVWFIEPATRMNPHLKYAQAVPGRNEGRAIGIIEAGGFVRAVDAAGLLEESRHWKAEDRAALKRWTEDFLEWLLFSDYGIEEAQMRQNHGTMYDVRVVRLALSLGRYDLARETLESVKCNRIKLQIEPDGAQPMELRRTKSFNYSEMNLTGLIQLATLGDWMDMDLWSFETEDGRSIRRALEFIRPFVQDRPAGWPPRVWPYQQIVPFRPEIFASAFRMAAVGYQEQEYEAIVSQFENASGSRFQLTHPAGIF